MIFTVSTLPFLALIAALYIGGKRQLFPVLMFMTVFQGAALVIVGSGASGLALAPAQVVLVLLLVQKALQKPGAAPRRLQAQTNVSTCLILYGSYAILSAIFCPFFFQGVLVSNPRNGMGAPLTWGMYNVTQSVYLLLGISVYFLCAYRSSADEIKRSLNWYIAGATFAGLLALYQFAAFSSGLPFPSDILHSNTQYTIFEAYEMNGYTRVNSTFTEASSAAWMFFHRAGAGPLPGVVCGMQWEADLLASGPVHGPDFDQVDHRIPGRRFHPGGYGRFVLEEGICQSPRAPVQKLSGAWGPLRGPVRALFTGCSATRN